ncbi:hypothetical protein [Sphingomonas colocasiae]|uniref:Uncharacterized protein n=1 Tax=Sphingomonas colocasiae TaxID=1848973 RepID=A0ABS7PJE3_9SPHN|nr:hypothetical protein [Sphingomonas colocasiae]MBY8821089.1 hypothetical protein [Sphingomonas colocasiae]
MSSPSDPNEPRRHPLAAHFKRRSEMRHEIGLLRNLPDDEILAACRSTPGFDDLESIYNFYIDRTHPHTLQLSFGNRSMFRMTPDLKKTAAESGPTLVYSFSGEQFVTILYPAKSDIARTHEDHLFLQIGETSAIKLIEGMPGDLRDLVAYAHVSSVDMESSFYEDVRIWALRWSCPRGEDGKFEKPRIWLTLLTLAKFGTRTATTSLIVSILKPMGVLIAGVLLAWLGFEAGLIQ